MKNKVFAPVATYRLQFNADFTFRDLEAQIDYLHALGITTIYASPIFDAAPGSTHGYDITNPHLINPAIGTIDELRSLHRRLQSLGMNWVQDIVPNHMALHPANTRLMDVLERGPLSPFYHYFDIDWDHPDPALTGKLMLPFLGQSLAASLRAKEIKLVFSPEGWSIQYGVLAFPLSAPAYELLLEQLQQDEKDAQEWIQELQRELERPQPMPVWQRKKAAALVMAKEALLQALTEKINEDATLLSDLLDRQYYTFTYWQDAEQRINYRRFFTVNGLIALRMEDEAVFNEYHIFLRELYTEGLIQGLRIDHIDGLQDPGGYIVRLRELMGDHCYIIAEKILAVNETLPKTWALEGSTGYEFLGDVNHLLTDQKGLENMNRFYRSQFPEYAKYDRVAISRKQLILETQMNGEWNNLVRYCYDLGLADHKIPQEELKTALGLLMVHMPVYRIYPVSWPLSIRSISLMEYALDGAIRSKPGLSRVFDIIRTWWEQEKKSEAGLRFLRRMMQFTGPITAKGVEDTTFYVYNALLSHNEVGDAPEGCRCSLDRFHEHAAQKQRYRPLSLNTTATHDTKRGEDGRIRLNVLTLSPNQWIQQVQHWHYINKPFMSDTGPDMNDEYFIYQSIISGFPANGVVTKEFIERFSAYMVKVLREAKVHSSWSAPNEAYEKACLQFIENLFAADHPFEDSIGAYVGKISREASVYTLTQTLIKITAPGVPDTYQGCELWDLSFVDPDNRRPVDYTQRKQLLYTLQELEKESMDALFSYLQDHRQEGMEKLYITWKALHARRERADLFTKGAYIPVYCRDTQTVIAYARKEGKQWCLVVAPLLNAAAAAKDGTPQHLVLPDGAPVQWRNIFTDEHVHTKEGQLSTALLEKFPVALLVND